jgi:hypothetical protein
MKSSEQIIRSGSILFFIAFLTFDIAAQNSPARPLPQFLFPEFAEGTIIMKDGKVFTSKLNYNMAEEIMISELYGVYRSANDPGNFDTIYLQNRTFVPVGKLFYELLAAGPATFLLQNKCYVIAGGSSIGYGMKSKSAIPTDHKRFELGDYDFGREIVNIDLPIDVDITPASVYWVLKENKLEKINSERQFLKLFPEKTAPLKDFIERENINFKVREDLISLGNYCNEIMK